MQRVNDDRSQQVERASADPLVARSACRPSLRVPTQSPRADPVSGRFENVSNALFADLWITALPTRLSAHSHNPAVHIPVRPGFAGQLSSARRGRHDKHLIGLSTSGATHAEPANCNTVALRNRRSLGTKMSPQTEPPRSSASVGSSGIRQATCPLGSTDSTTASIGRRSTTPRADASDRVSPTHHPTAPDAAPKRTSATIVGSLGEESAIRTPLHCGRLCGGPAR